MELELHELEFYAIFLKPCSDVLKLYSDILNHASFFLKSDRSIREPYSGVLTCMFFFLSLITL